MNDFFNSLSIDGEKPCTPEDASNLSGKPFLDATPLNFPWIHPYLGTLPGDLQECPPLYRLFKTMGTLFQNIMKEIELKMFGSSLTRQFIHSPNKDGTSR